MSGSNKQQSKNGAVKNEDQENKVTPIKVSNKPKKVAIVGTSWSHRLAPYDNPDYEIWGVNNAYNIMPRATRWFEIHEITESAGRYFRRGDADFRGQPVDQYLGQLGEYAEKNNIPVYMQRKCDLVKTATEYPLKEILQKFGNYFTNSISWMLALAINEGFEEIHVYGVDMAVDTEYHHQRPSCEFFLGIAAGLGIKVYIPPEADLLKTRFLYGFDEPQQREWNKKLRSMKVTIDEKRKRLSGEINHLQGEIKIREIQLQQFNGSEGALKEINKVWS